MDRRRAFSEKEQIYRQVLILCDSSVESHYNLGLLLKNAGKLEEAGREFDRAIKIKENPSFYVARGQIKAALSDPDAAKADFDQALKLDPKNSAATQSLSSLYMDRGEDEKALSLLDTKPGSTESPIRAGSD